MSEYLYPTTKGRLGLAACLAYMAALIFFPFWAPGLYPPLSQEPLVAKDQILNRSFHFAVLVTLVSIPPAVLIGWLHLNAIKNQRWPSLAGYVPFRVKVRQIKGTKLAWLSLIVFQSMLVLGVASAWMHHLNQRQFLAVVQ